MKFEPEQSLYHHILEKTYGRQKAIELLKEPVFEGEWYNKINRGDNWITANQRSKKHRIK